MENRSVNKREKERGEIEWVREGESEWEWESRAGRDGWSNEINRIKERKKPRQREKRKENEEKKKRKRESSIK